MRRSRLSPTRGRTRVGSRRLSCVAEILAVAASRHPPLALAGLIYRGFAGCGSACARPADPATDESSLCVCGRFIRVGTHFGQLSAWRKLRTKQACYAIPFLNAYAVASARPRAPTFE